MTTKKRKRATSKKLSEMTVKELEAEIAKNDAKRDELFKAMAPIERKLTRLYNANKRHRERIAKLKIEKAKNSKRTDWKYVLMADEGSQHYHYQVEALRSIGLSRSGYCQETMQTIIQVGLIKNDPESLKTTLAGLRKVLPHIEMGHEDKDGNPYKYIDIRERTLSAGGVYFLAINEEVNKYAVMKTTYGHTEEKISFDTLKKALTYIQQYVWYERVNERGERTDRDEYEVDYSGIEW